MGPLQIRTRPLKVAELLDLAQSSDEPEVRVEKIFDWFFERAMSTVRLTLGAAGAALLGLVAAYLQRGADLSAAGALVTAAVTGLSAAVLVAIGLRRAQKLNGLHREYVSALKLLAAFRRLRQSSTKSGP
jgi:hypothetical protein